jgi:flavin-dependent dehydrogenase
MGEAIDSYDVAILGGGPSGASAAIALAKHGLAVLVLERSRYDNLRIGETVPPQATQWLQQLGILNVLDSVPSRVAPGVVCLWERHWPAESPLYFNSYRHGWHFDRSCFDRTLAEAAERAGAVVSRGAVARSAERSSDNRWCLGVEIDGSRKDIQARWLVDATGRKSWFIRRQGVHPQALDRLVGLLGYVGPRASSDQRLYVEARPDGWWYSAPLPGERSIAGFMTDKDLVPHEQHALRLFWEEQRTSSQLISRLHAKPSAEIPLRVVAANGSWSGTVAGPQWIATGDAALAHDPLFGLGICYALESGWNAARALVGSWNGDNRAVARYQQWTEAKYQDYWGRYSQVYSNVTQWPDSKFWNRRSQAAKLTVLT